MFLLERNGANTDVLVHFQVQLGGKFRFLIKLISNRRQLGASPFTHCVLQVFLVFRQFKHREDSVTERKSRLWV